MSLNDPWLIEMFQFANASVEATAQFSVPGVHTGESLQETLCATPEAAMLNKCFYMVIQLIKWASLWI